jgi:hypothetical protein
VRKIIIEVPDEFEIKVEVSKGSKIYLDGGENHRYCYAEFDEKGVYELKKGSKQKYEMRVDNPISIIGCQNYDNIINGVIEVEKEEDIEPKKKQKPHPNPYTRRFKKERG